MIKQNLNKHLIDKNNSQKIKKLPQVRRDIFRIQRDQRHAEQSDCSFSGRAVL